MLSGCVSHMLSVVMLNVIMLSGVAPIEQRDNFAKG
jgi:hypothetical protein